MKRRYIPWLAAGLCIALLVALEVYPVRKPYQYPVEAWSEEWYAMTPGERQAACDVPIGLMKRMTTEALAETVLDHPSARSMAFNLAVSSRMPPDYRRAYDAAGANFQGLWMLESRRDGRAVLENIYAETSEEEDPSKRQYIRYILAAWDQGPSEPTLASGRIPDR